MQKEQKEILSEYFKDEILINSISNIATTCIMAMIAIPFFSFLDYFLYRDHLKTFIVLRIIIIIYTNFFYPQFLQIPYISSL